MTALKRSKRGDYYEERVVNVWVQGVLKEKERFPSCQLESNMHANVVGVSAKTERPGGSVNCWPSTWRVTSRPGQLIESGVCICLTPRPIYSLRTNQDNQLMVTHLRHYFLYLYWLTSSFRDGGNTRA